VRWASALALLVASCSDAGPQAGPSSASERFAFATSTGEPGKYALGGELEGCVIEIRPSVPTSILSICYVDGGGIGGPGIGGEMLHVSGRHLVLGKRRYGPLQPTSRVVIDGDGVHADGVLLGPLP
jgi:hypothetical protein